MLWSRAVDTALFVCMLYSSLGLCLHVTAEDCRSIRYLRCVSRNRLAIGVRHFDSATVAVAVGPDDVLLTILDLVVFSSLSRGGSSGRLFVVGLSVAPGMLLVGRRVHVLLRVEWFGDVGMRCGALQLLRHLALVKPLSFWLSRLFVLVSLFVSVTQVEFVATPLGMLPRLRSEQSPF